MSDELTVGAGAGRRAAPPCCEHGDDRHFWRRECVDCNCETFPGAGAEPVPPAEGPQKVWRCFWCDGVFAEYGDAAKHFGAAHADMDAPECYRLLQRENRDLREKLSAAEARVCVRCHRVPPQLCVVCAAAVPAPEAGLLARVQDELRFVRVLKDGAVYDGDQERAARFQRIVNTLEDVEGWLENWLGARASR